MAFNQIQQSGHVTYGLCQFVIDSSADIENLPLDIPMGSTAFCIEDGKTYTLNGDSEWV